jgi:mono/diheme cytochrome c family protein
MNYPVWYLPSIGGGLLIALIAITHVFVSHFAVGGGLYLVQAERKGLREKNQGIIDFTRRHAKFFLLMTMVFGSLTGVGIWFIIGLVNPEATSLMIHTFVFGWATEYVFFLLEIISLVVYYYTFDRLDPRIHQMVGWVYFVSAWFSLVLITGIIGFMLTPGGWLSDHSFWSGFFNPSFWPAVVFRTFVAGMFAGVYAFLTTAFLKDPALKRTMTRYSGQWVLYALLGAIPSGYWYLSILPHPVRLLVEGASPTVQRALVFGLCALITLTVLTLVFTLWKPALHNKAVAFFIFASAFIFMGAFEWTREASRRPYVINEVIYSTGIRRERMAVIDHDGFLHSARWAAIKELRADSMAQAGQEIFKFQCYACHTVGGINNDILRRTRTMDFPTMIKYLESIHTLRYFMPPFAGTGQEMQALATYLIGTLQGKSVVVAASRPAGAHPGHELFESHCTLCHPESLVKSRTAGWSLVRIRKALDNLNALVPAMPNYNGTPQQKDRIAGYILSLNAPGLPVVVPHGPDEDVFEKHCAMCHGLRTGDNPLLPLIAGWSRERIREALDRLPRLNPAMPVLDAPSTQKDKLADFLHHESRRGDQ